MGGLPSAVSFSAMRHLSAFVTAAAPMVEPGPTGSFNPAILTNVTYTVLIENCRLQHGVEFDHGEDLETLLVPVAEIPKLVADEKIGHSLVVVALYHFDLWQRGLKPAA